MECRKKHFYFKFSEFDESELETLYSKLDIDKNKYPKDVIWVKIFNDGVIQVLDKKHNLFEDKDFEGNKVKTTFLKRLIEKEFEPFAHYN